MIYNFKNSAMKLTLVVFSLTALLGLSVWQVWQKQSFVIYEKPQNTAPIDLAQTSRVEENVLLKKSVTFDNVSFTYDTSLFSNVKGELVEASFLKNVSDKPEGVYPRHINFIFENPYTGEQRTGKDYYSNIRIHVYPIEEFKQAYSPIKVESQREFDELRKVMAKSSKISPTSKSKQLPYLPFIDASQAFSSKSKVINFQNGKGLLYLTQWQQDESVINDERLELIFQGLSNDNKNFVLIEFEVSAKGLPQNNETHYPDKYRKLNDTSNFLSESYERLYKKYTLETAAKIDKIPSGDFTPNLNKIENLIRSFDIK